MSGKNLPSVLVTGFPPFPDAPVNPTQWLMEALDVEDFSQTCALTTAVLPVAYDAVLQELDEIARKCQPDIVIHFGLAAESTGIRLERLARNEIVAGRVDNTGHIPKARRICEGEDKIGSGLPLTEIAADLEDKGLPVQWSNDAGGYLCNFIFYSSRAGRCEAVKTPTSGFIHVPLIGETTCALEGGAIQITRSDLMRAAQSVIRVSVTSRLAKRL